MKKNNNHPFNSPIEIDRRTRVLLEQGTIGQGMNLQRRVPYRNCLGRLSHTWVTIAYTLCGFHKTYPEMIQYLYEEAAKEAAEQRKDRIQRIRFIRSMHDYLADHTNNPSNL